MPQGMRSARTPLRPTIMAPSPMRTNWRTATPPPNTTLSPTLTWPPSIDIVGEHDIVADLAIMRDVGADHEKAFVADASSPPRSCAVPVFMVTCFADVAIGADHEPRRLAAIAAPTAAGVPSEAKG